MMTHDDVTPISSYLVQIHNFGNIYSNVCKANSCFVLGGTFGCAELVLTFSFAFSSIVLYNIFCVA